MAVRLGQQGHAVGADLVGRVAVGRDAVGADDDLVHQAFSHQQRAGVVAGHGHVHAVPGKLVGGQARALKEGPGLVGHHGNPLARLLAGVDHAERRAVASGGQRARVAVGHDPVAVL